MADEKDGRTRLERARDEMPEDVYDALLAEALRLAQAKGAPA
jgi:hypothetical protein